MTINYEGITEYLTGRGFDAYLSECNGQRCLKVNVNVDGITFELIHFLATEFSSLPTFFLAKHATYGQLPHVSGFDAGLGSVCVGDRDSLSVNYEVPHLAIEASLNRHVQLLRDGITRPDWNKAELLREFHSNWLQLCEDNDPRFLCAANASAFEEMVVLKPVPGATYGYRSFHVGVTTAVAELSKYSYIKREITNEKRSKVGEGFVIPIQDLLIPPASRNDIQRWYLETIESFSELESNALQGLAAKKKAKAYWLIFNAETPSGRTWFGLHFKYRGDGKKNLPLAAPALTRWTVTPMIVTLFNPDRLMPRGGASTSLSGKKVLLVGCGSVGGEIAFKLAAAGIGMISLADPDLYNVDNLYRHVLMPEWIGATKTFALKYEIEHKYPWTSCQAHRIKLLNARDIGALKNYDIMVIAIGSPTHERLFHDYLVENNINIPVINTWVEGYGIGGHATLDIPRSRGCLRCAYVDPETLGRGLASNLNFLETDQNITVNHAGCGTLYLPYSAISAAQTALIASDLAVKYLEGKILESSRISWKGDDTDAREKDLATTHRYHHFTDSLQIRPLYNSHCDLCGD